jgi:hypothetical protein
MGSRRRLLRVLATGLAFGLLSGIPILTAAADQVAFTIKDPRITSSSGLVADGQAKVYWTVNRSPAAGVVFGLDPHGSVKGTLDFRAKPKDIEAVAMSGSRLFVADIGDKTAKRAFVTVYFFDNPQPSTTGRTVFYHAYDFAYPDGPHDAQTLLVNSKSRLFIVTKGNKAGIYAAPSTPSRQVVNKLRRVGSAPSYVTDGTFLPDQRRIALRTYVSVVVIDANSHKMLARAATPAQPQGESITVSLDRRSLVVGSEGKASKVYSMRIPTRVGDAPTPGSTPPPSTPGPSASPSSTAAEDNVPDDTGNQSAGSRTGTFLAVGLAAFVALIAGVVVGTAGKR